MVPFADNNVFINGESSTVSAPKRAAKYIQTQTPGPVDSRRGPGEYLLPVIPSAVKVGSEMKFASLMYGTSVD